MVEPDTKKRGSTMFYHRTADRLVEACILDLYPDAGPVWMDFGIDERTFPAYQKAVKNGKVTADQLHKAVCDGPKLSALIGVKVTTMFDMFA